MCTERNPVRRRVSSIVVSVRPPVTPHSARRYTHETRQRVGDHACSRRENPNAALRGVIRFADGAPRGEKRTGAMTRTDFSSGANSISTDRETLHASIHFKAVMQFTLFTNLRTALTNFGSCQPLPPPIPLSLVRCRVPPPPRPSLPASKEDDRTMFARTSDKPPRLFDRRLSRLFEAIATEYRPDIQTQWVDIWWSAVAATAVATKACGSQDGAVVCRNAFRWLSATTCDGRAGHRASHRAGGGKPATVTLWHLHQLVHASTRHATAVVFAAMPSSHTISMQSACLSARMHDARANRSAAAVDRRNTCGRPLFLRSHSGYLTPNCVI